MSGAGEVLKVKLIGWVSVLVTFCCFDKILEKNNSGVAGFILVHRVLRFSPLLPVAHSFQV